MAGITTQLGALTLLFTHPYFGTALFIRRKVDELGTRPTHILLVADAQIPMRQAHSQTITGLFHDVYMHRAWKMTRRLHPHLVLFLGDMLKTGRSVESDDE
jgi:hypothetical protein